MESTERQPTPIQKTSARHTTEAAKKVRKLVKDSFIGAREAITEGKPVAWYMVCYINPILMAMDIAMRTNAATERRPMLPARSIAAAKGLAPTFWGMKESPPLVAGAAAALIDISPRAGRR